MVVSVRKFIIDYPEFKRTDHLLIERKLVQAEQRTKLNVWGDEQELGIELLAAHLLSISPLGETAKKKDDENDLTTTDYGKERAILARSVACGLNRIT